MHTDGVFRSEHNVDEGGFRFEFYLSDFGDSFLVGKRSRVCRGRQFIERKMVRQFSSDWVLDPRPCPGDVVSLRICLIGAGPHF